MQKSTEEGARSLGSEQKSLQPVNQTTSENLPRNVSMQLYGLMGEVVKDKVSPSTVRAACACAVEIHRMLKLNLEIKKSEK